MKAIANILHLMSVVLLIAMLTGILMTSVLLARGVRLAAVESGSMVPALHRTDAILIWPTKAGRLRPGEVISLTNPVTQVTLTHRLQAVQDDGKLVTKGDANNQADSPTDPRNLKGRVVAVFPGLGNVLDQFHKPEALLGFLYIPLLIMVITEAFNLARVWRVPYRYPGYGM